MPGEPIRYDVVVAETKEVRVERIFRYAHVYPRTVAMLASGQIDVAPLITDTFAFADSIEAFARNMPPTSVKVQIELPT
jgi:D-xylulose reductase